MEVVATALSFATHTFTGAHTRSSRFVVYTSTCRQGDLSQAAWMIFLVIS